MGFASPAVVEALLDAGAAPTARTGGGTGFDPPAACIPDGSDGFCEECLKFSCCQALAGCAEDPDCTCFLNCLEQGNPLLQCQGACSPSSAASYLSMCAGNACFQSCG